MTHESYTLRLRTFTNGELYVYTINLPEVMTSEPHSWGSIKNFYKD